MYEYMVNCGRSTRLDHMHVRLCVWQGERVGEE